MTTLLYVLLFFGLVLLWLVLGGSSGRVLRIGRGTVEDFEAALRPRRQEGPAWMASGKVHRERYQDGRETFDLRCDGLRHGTGEPRLPAGGPIELVLDEEVLATVPLRNGRVRLALDSRRGDRVPPVREGTAVALRYEGHVLLQGVFERD